MGKNNLSSISNLYLKWFLMVAHHENKIYSHQVRMRVETYVSMARVGTATWC